MRSFWILFLLASFQLNGQDNLGCSSAIEVLTYDSIQVTFSEAMSTQDINDINSFCSDFESSIFSIHNAWYKFNFRESGDFIFTAKATDSQDVDFVMFTSVSEACGELNAIRCMQSGSNVNGNMSDGSCLGYTGLSYQSSDESESAGCMQGSDNFLAAVEVDTSLTYYLALANFSGVDSMVQLCFDGSAKLQNSTEVENLDVNSFVKIYAVSNRLYLDGPAYHLYTLQLFDSAGRLIAVLNEVGVNSPIDIPELARGLYIVQVFEEGRPIQVERVLLGF